MAVAYHSWVSLRHTERRYHRAYLTWKLRSHSVTLISKRGAIIGYIYASMGGSSLVHHLCSWSVFTQREAST